MSTKITSANFGGSYTSKFTTRREVDKKSPFGNNYNDILKLSDFSKTLNQTPINTSTSSSSKVGDNIQFNLNFFTESNQSLNVNGFLSESKQDSEFNISYLFEKHEKVNGEEVLNKYQFNLKINSNLNWSRKIEKSYEKEDVMDFVRRITNEVMEISRDKKKSLKGIIFDPEDLGALSSLNDKKMGNFLERLMSIIMAMQQLEEMREKKEKTEDVILKPERKSYEVTEEERTFSNQINYEASIKKIE